MCLFFNDSTTTEICTLSLHGALPICNNELCLWVTSEPLDVAEATELMYAAMPDFGDYVAKGQIEIHNYLDWYLKSGDRKSTRLNSSHANISYAVFCLKQKSHQSKFAT